MINGDGREWHLWISDAAQTFLQGRQDTSERNGPIFMQLEKGPILQEVGAYPAPLYDVEGNNKVKEELLAAKFERDSFDHRYFTHRAGDGTLDAMLIYACG